MTLEQAEAFLDERTIGFKKLFVNITGSVTTALLLSQMSYWRLRTRNAEGWFFKSEKNWRDETGLTRSELAGARKKLRALGFIEEQRCGWPATLYFRVDEAAILTAIALFAENLQTETSLSAETCKQNAENLQTGVLKTCKQNAENLRTTKEHRILHRLQTETTTETTGFSSLSAENLQTVVSNSEQKKNFRLSDKEYFEIFGKEREKEPEEPPASDWLPQGGLQREGDYSMDSDGDASWTF